MRTSGRTSAARRPSLLAIITISCTACTLAITCCTRGSIARVSRSMRVSHSTFSSSASVTSGSMGRYNRWPLVFFQAATCRPGDCTAMARAARDASSSAGIMISSE